MQQARNKQAKNGCTQNRKESQTQRIGILQNRKESENQNLFFFVFSVCKNFLVEFFLIDKVDSDSEKLIVAPRTFSHKSTAPAKIFRNKTMRQNLSNKNKPAKYLENVVL